jgi:hypothetical protein
MTAAAARTRRVQAMIDQAQTDQQNDRSAWLDLASVIVGARVDRRAAIALAGALMLLAAAAVTAALVVGLRQ